MSFYLSSTANSRYIRNDSLCEEILHDIIQTNIESQSGTEIKCIVPERNSKVVVFVVVAVVVVYLYSVVKHKP